MPFFATSAAIVAALLALLWLAAIAGLGPVLMLACAALLVASVAAPCDQRWAPWGAVLAPVGVAAAAVATLAGWL